METGYKVKRGRLTRYLSMRLNCSLEEADVVIEIVYDAGFDFPPFKSYNFTYLVPWYKAVVEMFRSEDGSITEATLEKILHGSGASLESHIIQRVMSSWVDAKIINMNGGSIHLLVGSPEMMSRWKQSVPKKEDESFVEYAKRSKEAKKKEAAER